MKIVIIVVKKTTNKPISHLLLSACITKISMFKVVFVAKILFFIYFYTHNIYLSEKYLQIIWKNEKFVCIFVVSK